MVMRRRSISLAAALAMKGAIVLGLIACLCAAGCGISYGLDAYFIWMGMP